MKSRREILREAVSQIREAGFLIIERGDELHRLLCRDLEVSERKAATAEETRRIRSERVREPIRNVAAEILDARPGLSIRELRALVLRNLKDQPPPHPRVMRDELRRACLGQGLLILKGSSSSTSLST